jgi:hypothetical protein
MGPARAAGHREHCVLRWPIARPRSLCRSCADRRLRRLVKPHHHDSHDTQIRSSCWPACQHQGRPPTVGHSRTYAAAVVTQPGLAELASGRSQLPRNDRCCGAPGASSVMPRHLTMSNQPTTRRAGEHIRSVASGSPASYWPHSCMASASRRAALGIRGDQAGNSDCQMSAGPIGRLDGPERQQDPRGLCRQHLASWAGVSESEWSDLARPPTHQLRSIGAEGEHAITY